MAHLREIACSRHNKILIAVIYCNALAALGLCIASLGPALLDLAKQTSSTLTATGYCFGVRSVGYLVGSFSGPLFDRFPGHILLGTAIAGAGLGSFLIPVVRSVYLLGFVVSLQGIGMGFCDCGANVMLIYLFQKDVGPWMQAMHAAFGMGAFAAPLLLRAVEGVRASTQILVGQGTYDAAFYIIGVYCVVLGAVIYSMTSPRSRGQAAEQANPTSNPTQELVAADSVAQNGDRWNSVVLDLQGEESAEHSVNGASVSPVRLTAIPEDNLMKDSEPTPKGDLTRAPGPATAGIPAGYNLKKEQWFVVCTIAALLFLYVGCETGFGAFITAYGVIQLHQDEADSQLLAGAYWGCIMVGRIAAIPIAMKVAPAPYLGCSMAGCVASTILLLIGQNTPAVVWIGTVCYGLSMACVFPTAVAMAEGFFPVHGTHATAFVVGSATGEMLLPFIISTLFGDAPADTGVPSHGQSTAAVGPVIMLWVVFVACLLNQGVYFVAVWKGKILKRVLESKPTVTDPAVTAAEATAARK